MRIKAKITPAEKATNLRENQKYTSCVLQVMIAWNCIGMYVGDRYFNFKLITVVSYDYFLND
jgi:hypothetical protein